MGLGLCWPYSLRSSFLHLQSGNWSWSSGSEQTPLTITDSLPIRCFMVICLLVTRQQHAALQPRMSLSAFVKLNNMSACLVHTHWPIPLFVLGNLLNTSSSIFHKLCSAFDPLVLASFLSLLLDTFSWKEAAFILSRISHLPHSTGTPSCIQCLYYWT